MRRKWKVLIMGLVLCLVMLGGSILSQGTTGHKVTNIESYEDIIRLLLSDCWSLKEALPAQHGSVSYIPEVGWLFIIENAGQFNFKKMAAAVQENLIGLDFLLVKRQITGDMKIFISFELTLGDDYILVFNAEDLSDLQKWEVYKGER